MVTKYPVRKIEQREVGQSTLGAIEISMDEVSGRLNTDGRGKNLGGFDTGDLIIAVFKDGTYQLTDFEITHRYDVEQLLHIGKLDTEDVISAVYYDGERKRTLVKRFNIETTTLDITQSFITEARGSKLLFATLAPKPVVTYTMTVKGKKMDGGEVDLVEFIDVKGWKSLGNKLSDLKLSNVKLVGDGGAAKAKAAKAKKADTVAPGTTISFEIESDSASKAKKKASKKGNKGQGGLF